MKLELNRAQARLLVITGIAALTIACVEPTEQALHEEAAVSEPTQVPRINVDALGRLPAFSHATTIGDLVFVSGTLGTKPKSIELVDGGVGPQTTQIMDNVQVILEEAGSSMAQLAKCIVYLTDMNDFAAMNEAWLAAVGDAPPARATIGVNELALGAVVEIECIAAR